MSHGGGSALLIEASTQPLACRLRLILGSSLHCTPRLFGHQERVVFTYGLQETALAPFLCGSGLTRAFVTSWFRLLPGTKPPRSECGCPPSGGRGDETPPQCAGCQATARNLNRLLHTGARFSKGLPPSPTPWVAGAPHLKGELVGSGA